MHSQTDEELMLAFKGGDRGAYEQLFARYRDAIYGYLRRRLNDPGRAEELTQDVFLALVERRNGYEVRASFKTYLYRIALHRLSSELRRRPLAERAANSPAEAASDPEVVTQVRQALARLDAEHREVVLLREYQQLSYAEIAEVLKIPVGTVRSRLFRAKLALRDLLSAARTSQTPSAPGSE